MKRTKESAFSSLSALERMFDSYNSGKLEGYDKSILYNFQVWTWEAYDLVKFLKSKDNCEETQMYELFCKKLIVRLSYLIHQNRIETLEELINYFKSEGK